ncbi:bifunctional demethylmenaquinone methyltransferase/2-methoxy-6-polyprenyl-1,4-benzoquinol methylase UbiE [Desulfobacterales bacterium HSG17]|nr:bifunctional demethylmenaquinone methyltransferase/2-methoxy-6-polyprenyl-1,4-benzoquinol methylase UbiE [Desulfobacterales bacterium HSG17]
MENKNQNNMKKRNNIKNMFDQISPRYVLMNKLMTFGQDRYWRKQLIKFAGIKDGDRLLDVATGTGDVIIEGFEQNIQLKDSVGLDFSAGMLSVAKSRLDILQIQWMQADALELPFKNSKFNAVTSAYLMRNAINIKTALTEQFRVLKPSGKIACLDTTPPRKTLISPLIDFYFLKIIPLLGALIASSKAAYTYLPETTKNFKTADELKEMMIQAGFQDVSYKKYMFGTIAIHWGIKPKQ